MLKADNIVHFLLAIAISRCPEGMQIYFAERKEDAIEGVVEETVEFH